MGTSLAVMVIGGSIMLARELDYQLEKRSLEKMHQRSLKKRRIE
jgi:hypothetical protein